MKYGDSDLLKPTLATLMHMGNVNEFSVTIYVITLPKLSLLLWPDAYQTGIWPKPKLHVQKTDFCPRILVLEEWKYSSSASHHQSTSHSEERALSTNYLRGTVSSCLGESKEKRHFSPSPGTIRAQGCCLNFAKTFRKVWIVEVFLMAWNYLHSKTLWRSTVGVNV